MIILQGSKMRILFVLLVGILTMYEAHSKNAPLNLKLRALTQSNTISIYDPIYIGNVNKYKDYQNIYLKGTNIKYSILFQDNENFLIYIFNDIDGGFPRADFIKILKNLLGFDLNLQQKNIFDGYDEKSAKILKIEVDNYIVWFEYNSDKNNFECYVSSKI